jgi:predicted nucleic acid binding AN1-type Zn finger protein
MIVEKQPISSFTTVISNPQNLNILVCCAMPVDKINNDQRVFIQAIMNEITMLFIILNSSYNKNENRIFVENESI